MADNSLRYRTNPVFPRTNPSTESAAPRGASRSGYDPDSRSLSESNADPLAELARLVGDVDQYGDTRVDTRPRVGASPSEAYPLSPAQSAHWDDAAARTSAPPLAQGEYETAGDEAYASEADGAEDDYAVDDETYDQADYDDQQQSEYYDEEQHSGQDPRYAAGQYAYAAQADPYAPYAETQPQPGSQRKTLLMAGAVFGLIVVGAIGAYAYRTLVGTAPGVPPVIMADSSPAKVAVTPSDTGNGKQTVDRVGDKPQNERVVSREERPVDLKLSAPQAPVPATGWAAPQQNAPAVNAAPQASPAAPSPTDPHPVRTVAIAPNAGTGAPPVSAPVAAAPGQAMPPAAAAPKAEQRVATQGDAPKPAQPTTPVARYVVQISASNTSEEATAALRAAQARYSDVLGGRHSQVKSKKSAENATVYAAQFGPFASRAEAAELCQRLKSAGGTCFVQ
jgi:SPOR domain